MTDHYAGIAGLTVSAADGKIVLDVSTPEKPEHTRLRLDRDVAVSLAWELLDRIDELDAT